MPASVFEVLDVRPIVVEGLGRDALLLPEHGLSSQVTRATPYLAVT